MTTITVERLTRDGPIRVGDEYVVAGDAGGHVRGRISGIVPSGPKHVDVTVELVESPSAV
jgi:hypothetical protein